MIHRTGGRTSTRIVGKKKDITTDSVGLFFPSRMAFDLPFSLQLYAELPGMPVQVYHHPPSHPRV